MQRHRGFFIQTYATQLFNLQLLALLMFILPLVE